MNILILSAGTRNLLVSYFKKSGFDKVVAVDACELAPALYCADEHYIVPLMKDPCYLDRILDDIIDVLRDPRVYRFLHIPVQSGSNGVLKDMKRHYTVNKFLGIVNRLRDEIPDSSIATDIICGFPGETDRDHQLTVSLIRKLRADTVNITRFSARPGTEAAEMKEVQGNVIKDRSQELTEVKNSVEYDVNSALIGKRFKVLVTEHGKGDTMIARTDNYRPVAIDYDLRIGDFVDVEITDCASTYLVGKLI